MKIALFLPNWIGDVVMATPAIRAVRREYPEAELIAVQRPYVADVLHGSPWFDRSICLEKSGNWSNRWPSVAWQLLRERVDLALLFPNSFRSALTAWLGGCRRRIGYDRYARGFMLTDRLECVRDAKRQPKPSPVIASYNRLAQEIGCKSPGHRMELFTTASDEAAVDTVWQRGNLDEYPELICFNPGAAYGAAKHWHAENFALLARNLVDSRGCGILVLCGPKEKTLSRQIATLSARTEVHSLADLCDDNVVCRRADGLTAGLSIGLTKACIQRSDLLITTDSGPRHFAAAFNRPVVTLFGPTHIAWTETFYAQAVHLQKKVDCGPCQLRTCPLDHRCMKTLTPAEVYVAATELFARNEQRKLPERKAS